MLTSLFNRLLPSGWPDVYNLDNTSIVSAQYLSPTEKKIVSRLMALKDYKNGSHVITIENEGDRYNEFWGYTIKLTPADDDMVKEIELRHKCKTKYPFTPA